jgi:ribose 5-phosphate isomerase B
MNIAIGTDHAGFSLKTTVIDVVRDAGHVAIDCGAFVVAPDDDYPDFAEAVVRTILEGKAERGVLLCGSGVGISIAANKFDGIRSALCHDTFSARQGVEDDAMNVLALGARVIGPSLAAEVVRTFLRAEFSDAARHRRRLNKVIGFEES